MVKICPDCGAPMQLVIVHGLEWTDDRTAQYIRRQSAWHCWQCNHTTEFSE